jgi:hypothetical protein
MNIYFDRLPLEKIGGKRAKESMRKKSKGLILMHFGAGYSN